MTGSDQPSLAVARRKPFFLGMLGLTVLVAVSLYWKLGAGGKEAGENTQCAASKALSERLAPLMQGEVAGVVAEMPALDALQAAQGDGNFEVVAVNTDTVRLDKRQAFLTEAGIQHLAFYADPEGDSFPKMKSIGKAFGLPTSVLIDKDGCLVAAIEGPAEWASVDAQKLVAELKK